MVLNEDRNPEETEEVMVSGSIKDASSSSVSTQSVRMELRPNSKSEPALFPHYNSIRK